MLGLISKTSRHGLSANSSTILFKALVRQLLEYASVVWSPYLLGQINHLESVQRRFVRHMGCRAGVNLMDVPVEAISAAYGLQSLECRRRVADVAFLIKLLNNQISSPFLLERINLHDPISTRHQRLFELDHASTSYLRFCPIPRLMRSGNEQNMFVGRLFRLGGC
ncbi:uncharacterized protein LOC128993015 [Macrosteles quadrilineatus]|uniref:uncharacterized protein LOC128993015 n=1 Tax=Macrosteles quadrilineatus TaxID=74068 RepID=UPI0023E0A417|nr:uncharacterized protein LOC128993015 [Macrosteles quadrilineatus]